MGTTEGRWHEDDWYRNDMTHESYCIDDVRIWDFSSGERKQKKRLQQNVNADSKDSAKSCKHMHMRDAPQRVKFLKLLSKWPLGPRSAPLSSSTAVTSSADQKGWYSSPATASARVDQPKCLELERTMILGQLYEDPDQDANWPSAWGVSKTDRNTPRSV